MKKILNAALLVTLSATFGPKPAFAHFKLLKPTSWLKEDAAGGPQKGGPCGPGGYDDTVKPLPTSGAVTDFHVGDTIEVDWVDTIGHPGYFRIALAQNRDDFKNPTIVQDASCNFDETKVPTMASGNVLADGVHFRPNLPGGMTYPAGTMFTQMVKLPDTPCDKCTLQVMQIMESDIKALSQCYYFHCADVRILAAGQGSGTGGEGNAGSGGLPNGTAGMTSVPTGGGGMTILTSSGGTLGSGGLLGGGGVLSGGTPGMMGLIGSGGTVAGMATAPSASGGTTSAGTPGTGPGVEPGGAAGAAASAASPSSEGSSCVVAHGRRAGTAAATGLALFALLAVARRRQAVRGRGK